MNAEERKAQYRAYYYRNQEKCRAAAKARSAQVRAKWKLTDTPEAVEARRRYHRANYAQVTGPARKAERQKRRESAQRAVVALIPKDEPARTQFKLIQISLLAAKQSARRSKQEHWKRSNKAMVNAQQQRQSERRRQQLAKLKADDPKAYAKYQELQRRRDKIRSKKLERRLSGILRTKIRDVITRRKGTKSARSLELIGCPVAQLMAHLAAQFKPGMNWDNFGWGDNKWTIDHIRPIASFRIVDPEQQRLAFHYSNLAPAWFRDNLAKGSQWNGRRWSHADHACQSLQSAHSPA